MALPLQSNSCHPSWLRRPSQRAETMKFLRKHNLYHGSIDAPARRPALAAFFLKVTILCLIPVKLL
jgi:hypothetical protein